MKRKLRIGILSMTVIMLSACGTKNEAAADDYTDADDGVIAEEETDTEAEAVEDADTDDSTDDYRKIYKRIVEEKEGDSLSFSLIYLDGDDMPELVIWDHYYLTYSVYTVKDGKSFCLIDSMDTVALEYYEYSGIVSAFARWNGGGDQGSYSFRYYQISGDKTITDDDEPTMYYIYDAVYDEEGKWTGGGVTQYYYMGQEIDEAAYEQMEDELGIVIDNGKSFGNSYERAEMLKLLPNLPAIPGIYDSDAVREAYDSVLDTLYTTYTLPDGTDLSYDGVLDLSNNAFAIYDIDQDSQEELIIIWETTYTARQSEIVYGYDSEAGTVRVELWQYPLQTFYDNGIVEVGLSHNQGLAGEMPKNMDFWPYFLYQYDKVSDTYIEIALVDAWNKAFRETDYNGNAFPDDIDVDGDGVVYMITNEGYERTVDGEAYQTWRDSFIGEASEMEIPFENMTASDAEESAEAVLSSDMEDWQAAYLSFLDDFESAEKYADRYSYGLIYVDEDEIPELSIRRMDEAGGCFILTYHDGVLDGWQSSRQNVTYIEKGNLICNSDGNNGCFYDNVYTIQDGKWCFVEGGDWGFGPDGIQYDENGEWIFGYIWNGEDENAGYWDGEEISEEEYNARLNSVYPTEQAMNLKTGYYLKEIRSVLRTGEVSSKE